ncbi:zinc-binding alcohol dehydrogenase family protein [Stutzerimonas nosocomialis]|uniref:zinc-binding alcohol dehydrogenase family protein n=1 Tax=Stutzerimonas nosocomialis TaxID=1056496 RepID=UPI0011097C83|nr:zinc-binding alcohol dehydrogenase family protein [Stutzerimonas nosocomialis]TLX56716.1 zinc-binding alcohol dehydrogenase family protein [Stutzerimonas nosocomialis]
MKAVAYFNSLPIDNPDALQDVELPAPTPGPRDLLVEVRAISVNPVDTKVRRNAAPQNGEAKVLGWDVAGVVRSVGEQVSLFKAGDEVFYAGSIARAGANSELHLVDERIVGRKPTSLGFAEAAALPLTSITAWELLFERLQVREGEGQDQRLLIVGAAGGVGSILTQLARQLTQVRVIGSASRPETQAWARELGAHEVVDHRQPLHQALQAAGIESVSHVASLTQTDRHFDQLVEALMPQGRLALIDDPEQPLDVMKLKRKSLSLHWELMFTRSLFETPDMIEQHQLLNRVSELVDRGVLKTTLGEHFGTINAANLRRAHALLESGKAKGKIVLEGF